MRTPSTYPVRSASNRVARGCTLITVRTSSPISPRITPDTNGRPSPTRLTDDSCGISNRAPTNRNGDTRRKRFFTGGSLCVPLFNTLEQKTIINAYDISSRMIQNILSLETTPSSG